MRKKIVHGPISKNEFEELLKARSNPFFFSKYIKVINAVLGAVPFLLYAFQRATLAAFIKHRFTIVLKFRQAGLTELIAMFCLWYAMYHPNKNIVIISIKETVAKKVLRKIKFMYRNLPSYLQVPIINGRSGEYGTHTEMEFSNGSVISSIPTTDQAGRSESVSLLVIDEAAIVRWANTIWASAFPTLSTGGRAILNSTPYGMNNFFHKMWVGALANGNGFIPIRLKWEMHPDRGRDGIPCKTDNPNYDPWWYNKMAASLGPRRTAQEIDGDFLTSGLSFFNLVEIREIEDSLSDYVRLDLRRDPIFDPLFKIPGFSGISDQLIIYDKPQKLTRYTIGGDIATGRARDYSTLTLGKDDGEEVGCFKAKIPIDTMTSLMGTLGQIYHRARLAPEANDIGIAVANKLQSEGYHNLYYSVKLVKKKREKRPKEEDIPGWYTTSKNRIVILTQLEEDIRKNMTIIKDPYFVQEAYTFIYDSRNKPVAQGKSESAEDGDLELSGEDEYVDDSILGKAIYNFVRKKLQRNVVILPQ